MSKNYTVTPLVIILDASESDLTSLRETLINSGKAHVVGTTRETSELGRLMASEPDIVLLDVGIDPADVHSVIKRIHEMSPRCEVILTSEENMQFDVSRAMMAGARGLLRKPIHHTDLINAIVDVFEAEQTKLKRIEDMARASAVQGRAADVITVFSPKGGVGCTTIACNLAITLANITKGKVALVDFSLQFGDVAVLLNLHSGHGIHELMRNLDDLDSDLLETVMVAHPSGIKVLLPPPTLELVDEVATDGMTAVIKSLRKYYDYVIIDTWHAIEEATLAVMDLSNTLLLVATPEVPALRNTRRLLDLIKERPDLNGKAQIIINRFPSRNAVGMKEIEHSLGMKPIGTIPSDGNLMTAAANEGVSFVNKPSAAANSLTQIANLLAEPRMAKRNRAIQEEQQKRPARMFNRAEGQARG